MKRRYKATGVKAKRSHLTVYVTVEVGTTVRFIAVDVPWSILFPQEEGIRNGLEREVLRRLEAEADVQYLPLERWE